MLRSPGPVQRRKPVRPSREPQRRERERRFVQAEAGEWHARMCAQDRAHKALRKHGVLIRLRLVLRDGVPLPDIGQAIEAFRREGFILWHEEDALILTGEPTLALTFMDIAAAAGILNVALRNRLKIILRSAGWLRAHKREDVLRTVPAYMSLFARIEPPS